MPMILGEMLWSCGCIMRKSWKLDAFVNSSFVLLRKCRFLKERFYMSNVFAVELSDMRK